MELIRMNDDYTENVMKGIRWIPILNKAMKIHEELEKDNKHDVFYKNSLGDILYLGLGFLQMMMDDESPKSLEKLIGDIREEYISAQEDNLMFMRVFGKYESEFENKLKESRMNKNRIKQCEEMICDG